MPYREIKLGEPEPPLPHPLVAANTVYVTGPGVEPRTAHDDDAGFDLHAYLPGGAVHVDPGGFVDLPHGVSIEMPNHLFGVITGRSSAMRLRGLHVVQGIIDPGYRGELYAGVKNLGNVTQTVLHHERVAQLLVLPNLAPSIKMVAVEALSPSARGTKGFGSTGR